MGSRTNIFINPEVMAQLERKKPHAALEPRGYSGVPRPGTTQEGGRFGRMFSKLPALDSNDADLIELGKGGGPMADTSGPGDGNSPIPAGFTYLGQFLDHDITFDPTSSLDKQNDPDALENFRTPRLDLDSLYMGGPADTPFIYDGSSGKLLLGQNNGPTVGGDLPRNSQGVAIVGDPRNDENLVVAQLHQLFMKFHNNVVDWHKKRGTDSSVLFNTAQQTVRWHYQWMITHDFLPRICGQDVVDSVLKFGRKFYDPKKRPFMPVEFSVAAYRFGHSMVRQGYRFNDNFPNATMAQLFQFTGGPVPSVWFLEPAHWANFFEVNPSIRPNLARAVDTKLAPELLKLPFIPPDGSGGPQSLASRNLLRGDKMGLPSGQAVAARMGIPALTPAQLAQGDTTGIVHAKGFDVATPLWFYVLKEGEVLVEGKRLGPVGARIVAEVIIGLLQEDSASYLNIHGVPRPPLGLGRLKDVVVTARAISVAESVRATEGGTAPAARGPSVGTFPSGVPELLSRFRSWKPFLPSATAHTFTMADLVRFATSDPATF